MKKFLIVLNFVIVIFFVYSITKTISDNSSKNFLKYNTSSTSDVDYSELENSSVADYYAYLQKHDMVNPKDQSILVRGDNFTNSSDDVVILSDFEGKSNVVRTEETSNIVWTVDVPVAGFYNIKLNYFPVEGKGTNIERTIYINDEIPFSSAKNMAIHRFWGSESTIKQDIYGNDIRPSQIEKPIWSSTFLKDSIGYIPGNFAFYFKSGQNKIELTSDAEPIVIESLELLSINEAKDYSEVKKEYEANSYKKAEGNIEIVEGENLKYTTSPTIYPLNDRGASTSPNKSNKIRLNTIGGQNWRISGDKIVWNFKVEETGLYNISLRVRQNLASGMTSSRNIYINGEIPFKELENYSFKHNNSFRIQSLGTDKEAFEFYFEAGKVYEIALEASLGSYGFKIAQIESSINELSKIYREILKRTTSQPDPNKDYQLEKYIPTMLPTFEKEYENLTNIREDLINISGSKSEKTGILDTILVQLADFLKRPSRIHRKLSDFNNNISSLGTLVILLSDQPLEIDYFVVHSGKVKMPKNNVGVFKNFGFQISSFFSTFFTDYSSIGKTNNESSETIEVWLTVGKDQANILRKLIDEKFTPEYGIQVDLKLVSGASLLPATLAGKGPDIAMGVDSNTPVNYAMRKASYDLTKFDDFNTITDRFMSSAFVPFEFNEGIYALPEQQTFLMMFYRTDIFEELDLPIPNTWDDVISIIPDLQTYNLEYYLPVPRTQGAVVNLPVNPIFGTLFYQNDGKFYINNNSESGFNEGVGPEIFERWTEFYTDYSFPVEANFTNRFRSGQMPMGITYYNIYNTLSVFAPEIRGKWGFLPVPGTEYTDEFGNKQIRRETVSSNTGVMLLNDSDKKAAAWEYMKWWTSEETQVRFGREMEGILGAAARYPTANVKAFESLPWRQDELAKLKEQWEWVRGIPEVPGSYMTGRHLDNAFRKVINEKANAREVIYDYVQIINEEIRLKREEFNLG
ncbi:extracellular solute-binding protein [Haploplasma modicum]|uniref:extracellular solute-binding protein n=1 Tax=Haploplasma modicum TaxID=2150 RepID=UPI00214CECF7|nr:extracellular solute-binding protein [Haploplasma modicum]MCR1809442.1 extracellular solute-binding protein [Haploplasma modicum]